MYSPWLSFVPHDVAAAILAAPTVNPATQERRGEAVALFADVSGFTAISEALGRSGRAGTEELTTILNSYFEPMIALVESYGGIVGKFGGDAMTILFPCGADRTGAVCRAIQCALEMQANMGRYESIPTSAGSFGLAMKAGLAIGSLLYSCAGSPTTRLEYLIAGGVLDCCADAEHHAGRGEVVIHKDLLTLAATAVVVEQRGDFACISGLAGTPVRASLPQLPEPGDAATALMACFLPPAVAQRIASGQSGFINEHRRVTTLFVAFEGFDYDHDLQAGAKLRDYLAAVIDIVARYDGYLNKVDMGDKGSKYIVLFGAPIMHEDAEERALHCALDLLALPQRRARIGLNSGFVYCGLVGGPTRREYTVMGDPVNLAARLMQAAQPGQVLVGEETRRRVQEGFDWRQLDPMPVKGKREPVTVFELRGQGLVGNVWLLEPRYELPMVGRRAELETAEQLLELARTGHGQLLGVSAEAGMGKSRFGAAIVELAAARGFLCCGGACQSYGTGSGYLVWRDLWRGFFEIDADLPSDEQINRLEAALTALDPPLARRAPLLGPLLNLPVPDNELTRGLDPELRSELLRSLLLECLRRHGDRRPLLFVLEDLHWIDPLSQELLLFLGRNLTDLPLLLLALYRPPYGESGPLDWGRHTPHVHTIVLTELPPEQARELAALKLVQLFGAGAAPSEQLVAGLVERAQGNPFYLEEMVNFVRDRQVDPTDTAALAQLDLPDSLHSLILSRIDRLDEAEQTTIKVASVIGRLFRAAWLWGAYPELGSAAEVNQRLERLRRLDLTPLDKPEPDLEYLFKHSTTQEVAYNSMSFATRAELHERVGNYLETEYDGEQDRYLDLLAYHYGRSQNQSKQRTYFRRAGAAAQAAYNNEVAIDYYQRLLALLPEAEQAPILLDLGEVQQLSGKWAAAQEALYQAIRLATIHHDRRSHAYAYQNLGDLLAKTRSYDEAKEWLQLALDEMEQLADVTGQVRTLNLLSFASIEQSDYDQAMTLIERLLGLADQVNDQKGVNLALANRGLIFSLRGMLDDAEQSLAVVLARLLAAGDRRNAVLYGTDLAGVYWRRGEYQRALQTLQQTLSIAYEIGYLQPIGFLIGNAGIIYAQQGEYAVALSCYLRGLRVAADLGDWSAILPATNNIGAALLRQGRLELAAPVLARAGALARELNIPYELCETLYYSALLLTHQVRYAEARPVNSEALEVAERAEHPEFRFKTRLLAIRLAVALGEYDVSAAIAELAALRAHWEDNAEQAAIAYEIWRLDPANQAIRSEAAERYQACYAVTPNIEYRSRYRELTGAELPPPPPLPLLDGLNREPAPALIEILQRVGVEFSALDAPPAFG